MEKASAALIALLIILSLAYPACALAEGPPVVTLPQSAAASAQPPEKAAQDPARPPKADDPPDSADFIAGKLPYKVSTDVKRFGYDLFLEPPSTFAPVDNVPVGPDYLLGPGDEIRMNVWGAVNSDFTAVIDRDGRAMLPQAGAVQLSGLTFGEAKELIMRELYRLYRPEEVKLSISMGRLRTIRVYVVGRVVRPGGYTVSSLSTAINALFASGGPSRIGSMRDIQLKRSGKTVVSLDLYDFLLKGDKSKDVRLMPEDVIFIPPVGPLALVAGQVKAPGIYEMKGETRIKDLIAMAGGVTATGYLQKVQVERVCENEVRKILDADLKELTGEKDAPLTDGTVVKVYPIPGMVVNAVNLSGNVLRPGQYQWSQGMRVSALFKDPEKDLLPETCYTHALIERLTPPDYHREIISFDLGKALFDNDGGEDKELMPYDTVTVYSRWDFTERPETRVSGAVNRPGAYELRPRMRVSDLVKLSGGLLYYASYQAELTRVEVTQSGPIVSRVGVDLSKAMTGSADDDLPLKPNDYLSVRTVPEWGLYKVVKISGEVLYPGSYTIEKGETLSSVIRRAGGFTGKAYLKGAVFTRESVRAQQQKGLDEIIERVESQVLMTSASTSSEERAKQLKEASEERRRAFIAKLKSAKALGRIAIRMAPEGEFAGSSDDIELDDGDSLTVPREPASVQVAGAVYNQGAFVHRPAGDIGYYISKAGGATRDADEGEIYVLKADGTTISKRSGRGLFGYDKESHSFMGGGFMSRKLDAGDTVVVPECFEKADWLGGIRDVTTILFQIAVSAGVVIAAF